MTNKMLFFISISAIVNAITSTILGIVIYRANRHSIVNRTFAVFAAYVALWSYPYILWPFSQTKADCLFWFRMLHIGAILIPVGFYHFVISFLGKANRKSIILAYFIAGFFLAFSFSKYYILDMKPISFLPYYGVPGVLYVPFLIMFFAYTAYSLYLLLADYRSSEPQRKSQIFLVGVGTLIGFAGGSTNYLPWFNIPFPPFLNCLVSVYVMATAYAIVKHKFLDIEVIVKRTLVFAGLLASIFAMLVLPTLIIQEYLLRTASSSGKMVGITISGIIIILTMRRIESFLINLTDKYLFQKKYDYKELLKTFTTEVLTVLQLDKLVSLTVDKLTDIVKMKSAAVLLFDDEKQQFNVMASRNIKDPSVTLVRPDGIVTFMDETHGYVLVSELREKNMSIPDSIQEIIDKLNAELIIPMVLHEEVTGVLSLGKKKSDENYTQDDLDILLPLAKTLAIAISNAELFVELGKAQAEASQREKMAVIGTLSAGINHEICNPLGIARGQCEAFLLNLKDGLYKTKTSGELIEKAKDIMTKVIKETDRATAITKKLSSFAKPSKGEAEIVHIDKEVDEVFGLVGYELRLDKIEFHKDIQKNIPDLFVDKKQFQEVLFNLIRNAGQAIGEKGKVTITVKEENGNVFIDVQDTGSGIPEDKVKQLFNPFFTTKDPGKGTGLGLFIVRQVVEKNKGRIYLKETKVGEGTTFRLEFPLGAKEGIGVSK